MAQYKSSNRQTADGKVSERVVAAVAAARDEDPLELPPLYDVIDPDALNNLFAHGFSGRRNGSGRVSLMLADCEVVVHSDGEIAVTAPDGRAPVSSTSAPADEQDEVETTLE